MLFNVPGESHKVENGRELHVQSTGDVEEDGTEVVDASFHAPKAVAL